MIVRRIHSDCVVQFKALKETTALFCTFNQSYPKTVITIPAFLCIYINTPEALQNSNLSAVSASVAVVFVGVAVGWQER